MEKEKKKFNSLEQIAQLFADYLQKQDPSSWYYVQKDKNSSYAVIIYQQKVIEENASWADRWQLWIDGKIKNLPWSREIDKEIKNKKMAVIWLDHDVESPPWGEYAVYEDSGLKREKLKEIIEEPLKEFTKSLEKYFLESHGIKEETK